MGNEVGIIGQMYENRTNHKIGVLESRDEKYKTLLMRDKEGNTFNINFSTFKSSWRKYAGSEIIETSTQKEEKKSQKKDKAVKAKKVVEETTKKSNLSQKEKVQAVHALRDILTEALSDNKVSDIEPKITYKGCIKLRYDRHTFVEVWRARGAYVDVYVNDILSDMIEFSSDEIIVKTEEKWMLKTRYTILEEKADILLKVVAQAMGMYVIADRKAKHKKEEE